MIALALPGMASAQGTTHIVNTTVDDPGNGTCTVGPCSLREAVGLAVSGDGIFVPAGTYTLNNPQFPVGLIVDDDVSIVGAGARSTIIDGNNARRVFEVGGAAASISNLTVTRGTDVGQFPAGSGGGIVVGADASLQLVNVAVVTNAATNGPSAQGGGIYTEGVLELNFSTVAQNVVFSIDATANGGGIYAGPGATVTVTNSTISGNGASGSSGEFGGGIYSSAQTLSAIYTTIASNQAGGAPGGGLHLTGAQSAGLVNTIVADNSGLQCAVDLPGPITSERSLVEDTSCQLTGSGDQQGVDPRLGALTDNGGPTNTQALGAGSPAIDAGGAVVCAGITDQRGVLRPQGPACDIGAYEVGVAPPQPTPTPTATPTPTPTPRNAQQLPPPVAGELVNAIPKQGSVLVKLPGSNRFVRLEDVGRQLPVGTIVDVRRGRVTLIAAADRTGGTATADFYGGIFRLRQTSGARPITRLTLVEKLSCGKGGKQASAAAKRKKKRRLWGDGNGRFRTEGEYSSATVRGTKWLTEDRCTTTLTRVVRGVVTVRDFAKRKNIRLRAGKRYIARSRR